MINVYVVWIVDGPVMTTLLQFPDTPESKTMIANLDSDQFVSQAKDVEEVEQDASYELAAIFTGNIEFIY